MSLDSTPPSSGGSPGSPRVRRQRMVVAGVLLTFGGLLLSTELLPTQPAALVRSLPLLGGVLLAVWLGGILLGGGPKGRRRAPPA